LTVAPDEVMAGDAKRVDLLEIRMRRRIEPEPDMPRYLLSEPAIGYRIGCPA